MLEIVMALSLVLTFLFVWTGDISIETQYLPTIINGLTTSVAVMIGFGATCLTMMRAYYPRKQTDAMACTFLLMMPIGLLSCAYIELVFLSDLKAALRLVMSSFISAVSVVFAVLYMMAKEHW